MRIHTGIMAAILALLFCFNPSRIFAQTEQEKTENAVLLSQLSISELKLRGRIQNQYANSVGNNNNTGTNAENYSSFEIRRLRLGVEGKIHGNWTFMAEANVLSNVNLDAAILSYIAIQQANITIGKAKPRFGHEQNTSSASILTFERTRLDGLMNGQKPIGLRLHGETGFINYYLGVYNGETPETARMNSGTDSYLYNASLGISLAELMDSEFRTDLRADFLFNGSETGYYRFENAAAFSVHFKYKALDIRTEYMNGKQFDDNSLNGFYIMPSYILISEKLQAVGRYENISGDSGISVGHNRYAGEVPELYSAGEKYNALYAGLNYYIYGNSLKLMLGMEVAENSTENAAAEEGRAVTMFGGVRMQF